MVDRNLKFLLAVVSESIGGISSFQFTHKVKTSGMANILVELRWTYSVSTLLDIADNTTARLKEIFRTPTGVLRNQRHDMVHHGICPSQ